MKTIVIPARTYAVPVIRYEDIPLRCSADNCPEPNFLASFDEVQRILACPSCGQPCSIPEQYRGLP